MFWWYLYLKWECERKVSLHPTSRGKHYLMGTQDSLRALERCKQSFPHKHHTQIKYIMRFLNPITTHLNLNCDDDRNQLLIKFPHHNKLLQCQTAQPIDKKTDLFTQLRSFILSLTRCTTQCNVSNTCWWNVKYFRALHVGVWWCKHDWNNTLVRANVLIYKQKEEFILHALLC